MTLFILNAKLDKMPDGTPPPPLVPPKQTTCWSTPPGKPCQDTGENSRCPGPCPPPSSPPQVQICPAIAGRHFLCPNPTVSASSTLVVVPTPTPTVPTLSTTGAGIQRCCPIPSDKGYCHRLQDGKCAGTRALRDVPLVKDNAVSSKPSRPPSTHCCDLRHICKPKNRFV